MRYLRVRPIALGLAGLFLALLSLALLSLAQPGLAAQMDSGVYVDIRESDSPGSPVVERWKLYGESHALVIGIDNYTNGWPRLSNAVKDAREVAAAMKEHGFKVQLLTDVKSAELRTALRTFFAIKGRNPEARLFLWFAGHGYTELDEGYIVPVDAPLPENPEFLLLALHMGDFGSMVRIARAKHVFAIFDSCFAGTIFTAQRARPPAAITRAAVQPVRQFLTSGDADQQVSDDGTFRKLFLRALRGEEPADSNKDGYLTGNELSYYLENRIINLTEGAQTPRGGKLRDAKFDRGDFVFLMPHSKTAKTPKATEAKATPPTAGLAGPSESALDLEFWNAIKGSNDPGDYQAYLESFSKGRFASLARRRAKVAEAQAQSRPAAPARGQEQQVANLTPSQASNPKKVKEAETYLKKKDYSELRDALAEYDKKTSAFSGSTSSEILKIYTLKVIRLNGDRIFADITFCLGERLYRKFCDANTYGGLDLVKLGIVIRRTGEGLVVVAHAKSYAQARLVE